MPFTAAADSVALLPAMVTPEPLEETGPPSPRSPIGWPVPAWPCYATWWPLYEFPGQGTSLGFCLPLPQGCASLCVKPSTVVGSISEPPLYKVLVSKPQVYRVKGTKISSGSGSGISETTKSDWLWTECSNIISFGQHRAPGIEQDLTSQTQMCKKSPISSFLPDFLLSFSSPWAYPRMNVPHLESHRTEVSTALKRGKGLWRGRCRPGEPSPWRQEVSCSRPAWAQVFFPGWQPQTRSGLPRYAVTSLPLDALAALGVTRVQGTAFSYFLVLSPLVP